MWVVFLMAEDESFDLDCSFCNLVFQFPKRFSLPEAQGWIAENHLPRHADDMTGPALSRIPTGGPMCNRCRRYGAEGITPRHPLHRACYSAEPECLCPCSPVPALEESHVAE